MKKEILITAVIFALASSIKAYAYDDGDFQVWNTEIPLLYILGVIQFNPL